jgi:hypothetical protein
MSIRLNRASGGVPSAAGKPRPRPRGAPRSLPATVMGMNHNHRRRGHYIGPRAAIGTRGHDTARKRASETKHNQQFDNGLHY